MVHACLSHILVRVLVRVKMADMLANYMMYMMSTSPLCHVLLDLLFKGYTLIQCKVDNWG